MSHASRLTAYSTISTALALLSDQQLGELVGRVPQIGSGIGGTAVEVEIEGKAVFVKRVPLTDLELRPGNIMSTANVFGLPAFCHYGIGSIGSPGFGVWREVALHTMTTNWVLGDECENFPLMYHWRVLPDTAPAVPEELRDVEKVVEYWGGSPTMRERVQERGKASASVALFLENIPQTLHQWLGAQMSEGGQAAQSACTMVDEALRSGTSFMNSRGLLHFDAHFENVLTDGRRLFFTDFGLAAHSRFELSEAESAFFREHLSYDHCYTVTHLVNWLVVELYGYGPAQRGAFVRKCAEGKVPEGIPESAAAIITRYAALATVMGEFYRELRTKTRSAPYPVGQIERVCAASGLVVP
jgi:hypothetical protein